MISSSPTALIFGASGFTGKHLSTHLEGEGWNVFGASRTGPLSEKEFYVDLEDIDSVALVLNTVKPNYIIHLAAISYVAHTNIKKIYDVNVMGTRNVLRAAEESNIKFRKILLASSANVYGNSIMPLIDEYCPLAPTNDYGVSKCAMEHIANLWRGKLPIIVTRPFNYTGIGQAEYFVIPKIVNHFKNKSDVIELGNIDVIREYNDVRDVVDIYKKLLFSKSLHETYNICSGVGHTLSEVFCALKNLTGFAPQIKINPNLQRKGDIKTLLGDNSKLLAEIGNKNYTPLQNTLEWMYNK